MKAMILSGAVGFALAFAGTALAVDDFQCFKAKDTAKAFVKTSASVDDTFAGSTVTDFKKPFLLCDSASIDGDAQSTPGARLSCYKVKGAKLPAKTPYSVTDDFGTRSEEIQKVFVVCDGQASTIP